MFPKKKGRKLSQEPKMKTSYRCHRHRRQIICNTIVCSRFATQIIRSILFLWFYNLFIFRALSLSFSFILSLWCDIFVAQKIIVRIWMFWRVFFESFCLKILFSHLLAKNFHIKFFRWFFFLKKNLDLRRNWLKLDRWQLISYLR